MHLNQQQEGVNETINEALVNMATKVIQAQDEQESRGNHQDID